MHTGLPPAPAYRLPGVRLFASGTYRGTQWSPAVVDAIAATTAAIGPAGEKLHVPPGVSEPPEGGIGHDERETELDWLERTDLPAAGWVDPRTVKSIPDPDFPGHRLLVGDLVNLPPETAAKVWSGEYATGSAELYDDFRDDFGKSRGPALRRYCLMGGWVPQVKRLGRLPMPVPMTAPVAFGEVRPNRVRQKTTHFFGERTVDKASMLAALKAAMPGLSDAFLGALSDEHLAELVANVPAPAAAPAPPGPVAPMAEGDPAPEPMAVTREVMIAALVAAGQDEAAMNALDDAILQSIYDQLNSNPAPAPEPVAPMGEPKPTPKPATPDAVQAAIAREQAKTQAAIEQYQKMGERLDRESKAAQIKPVRDDLVKQGFTPAFVDAWLVPQLNRLDNTDAVHTFAEGGKQVKGTAFQLKLSQARQLDPRKCFVSFAEKLPGGDLNPQTDKAAAVKKATTHAETVPESAWKQSSFKSRAGFVAKFGETFDKSPDEAMKMIG